MSIFKKRIVANLPKDCQGLEVKIMSSTCTGEKTIGFYDRIEKKLKYSELVRNDDDISAFYDKYGLKRG